MKHPLPRSLFVLLVLLHATPSPAESDHQSAERLDWHPRETLPAEMQTRIPATCSGLYIDPMANAALTAPSNPEGAAADSVNIQASYVESLLAETFNLDGNVVLEDAPWRVTAKRGHIDLPQGKWSLQEEVELRGKGLLLRGAKADYDRPSNTARVGDGQFVLHERELHGDARQISLNRNSGIMTLKQATLTGCPPGDNSWRLRSDYIRLDPKSGFGSTRNARIELAGIPTLQLPYFYFPIDDRRHSGFLIPSLGNDLTNGLEATIPYYFNLAPNYDYTLTPRLMSKRGALLGNEFRYLTEQSRGDSRLSLLPDDLLGATSNPERSQRWLYGIDHRTFTPSGWDLSLDLNRASDRDYFVDLGGKGLDSHSLTNLRQAAEAQYRFDDLRLSGLLQSFQSLDAAQISPYRTLPSLTLDYQPLIGQFLVGSLYSNFSYFDRDTGGLTGLDALTGGRLSLDLALQRPWRDNFAFVIPSVKLRHRQYQLTDPLASGSDQPELNALSMALDSGLVFERPTQWRGAAATQTLEPRLYLLSTSTSSAQRDFPLFDTTERPLTYTTLFSDNRFVGGDRISDGRQANLAVSTRMLENDGQESWRLSLGQIFYLKDREVTLQGPPGSSETDGQSAYLSELAVRLNDRSSLLTSLTTDNDLGRVDEALVHLHYAADPQRLGNLGYRLSHDAAGNVIKQSDLSFLYPVGDRVRLLGRWRANLAEGNSLEEILGAEYEACCWKVRLVNRRWRREVIALGDTRMESTIELQLILKGLFGLGNRLDELLVGSIQGYPGRDDRF